MYLKTEEVKLYYEVRGNGNPLLLIHGVVVDAALYEAAAELLSSDYRVITYDRRGNSRSREVYKEDYTIAAQVRDAVALMDALHVQRAFVAGASAGGIVGQELLKAHPERVFHLLMYEPPLVSLLSDDEEVRRWVASIETYVERRKMNRAMMEFMFTLGETDERRPKKPQEVEEREINNFTNFLHHEFYPFMHYAPDIAFFKTCARKITIAVGEHTGPSKYVEAAKSFQQQISSELLHFPGCHNLPGDLPLDFANCMTGLMVRRRWLPASSIL